MPGAYEEETSAQMPSGKNYFPSQTDSASGFKYRVEGEDVVQRTINALRGGVKKDNLGRVVYDDQFRLMNDIGVSRAQLFLQGIINKNTHLSRFRDEQRILRQIKAVAKEWCVTVAQNRRHWEVKDPDLVQQVVETAILTALLRADEGFEAGLSSKSHHVMETYAHRGQEQQQGGILSRLNPFNWGGR